MTDPTTVTGAQIRAAYDALGLDPDGWRSVEHILVDTTQTVTVRRRSETGFREVYIPIDWSRT